MKIVQGVPALVELFTQAVQSDEWPERAYCVPTNKSHEPVWELDLDSGAKTLYIKTNGDWRKVAVVRKHLPGEIWFDLADVDAVRRVLSLMKLPITVTERADGDYEIENPFCTRHVPHYFVARHYFDLEFLLGTRAAADRFQGM